MFSFFSKQKSAIGLDISENTLRILQLQKTKDGIFPVAFFEQNLKKGIIEDGNVKNAEELSKNIVKAMRRPAYGKFDSQYVVISLPDSKSFVRVISVPKMSEEEAKETVPLEAEQYIPVSIDQVYLDFEILDKISAHSPDKMEVVIMATPITLADGYLDAIKNSKLKPVGLELESVAVVRSLIENDKKVDATLVLDMSASRTNLIIYDQGSLQFTSSLPVAGNNMTSQIAQRMTVTLEEAEKIKQQNGLLGLKSGKQIKEILDPPLRSLVEAIKNSINFYQEHSDGSRNINKILLSGGGSKLKGLREYLNSQLKPVGQISGDFVEIGDPWINVLDSKSGKVPPISKLDSVSYVTSIGLALRGLDME
ncbi:MAG: hypothetical protein A2826_02200 [Candidatus Doudnabacteria bacterium RIFCSPHIGHO2_01_FULL_43_23]|uniref:SHS2 domain-containing protein n=1 Tax=Candidatus Doudnabacteria bacterium RIFCSPHIGHO2_01_FULL_43_23 TaxID=1817822 RepID=A0A1F5NUK3_9BACT|nr:MAG: hypothetical protein A2826_02200 [Candidatus Doudnabacteria bacterium RIFCSPHIGHO2_01_FULL_43_23]